MAYYGKHKLLCIGYLNGMRVSCLFNKQLYTTLAMLAPYSLAELSDKTLSDLY